MRVSRLRSELQGFAQDLRHGSRSLCRSVGSTLLAVLTLGLGIGGATAFFGLLDGAFLRPLPFPETDRLVRLFDAVATGDGGSYLANIVPRKVDFLQRHARVFDRLTWQRFESFALLGAGDPVQVGGASLSPGSAEVLGLRPVLGRVFDATEEAEGEASGAVIVSHELWRDRFASDPGAIGKTMRLGDRVVTVIGVAQPNFHFPYRAEVWQPLRLDVADGRDLLVIGRLRPNATVSDAQAEMSAQAGELSRELGGGGRGPYLPIHAVSLREELLRDQQQTSIGLFLTTLLFLVMACANVAGLLVARSHLRGRELAIRSALGSSGWQHVRLAVAEPLLLAMAGGAVALGVLRWATPALASLVPQVLSEELGVQPVHFNWRVGAFALAASIAAAVLAGLGPVLPALRTNAALALDSGRTPLLGQRRRGLRALLAAEIGLLSLLLLASAALVAGFLDAARAPLGFEPRGAWAFQIVAPTSRYDDPTKLGRLVESISNETLPMTRARVAVSTINPVEGATWGDGAWLPETPAEQASTVNLRVVTPGFFETLGIELASGRDFARSDAGGPPAVIVSHRLARRLWKRDDVVGESLLHGSAAAPIVATVVGVARDVEDSGELRETIYSPFAQLSTLSGENQFWVVARGTAGDGSWVRDLERAIWRIDPQLAWSDAAWMDSMRSRALDRNRLGSRLASLYSGFGLLLAGLGLGGTMAFLLAQRQVELGVRQALGATRGDLLRTLTSEGMAVALVGLAAGLGAFLALRPALAHWVPDVARPAPAVWALVAGLILSVSAIAAFLPARRAAALDPMAALREG